MVYIDIVQQVCTLVNAIIFDPILYKNFARIFWLLVEYVLNSLIHMINLLHL